jgi:hypothetical protein
VSSSRTPGGQLPSALRGDQPCVRTHSEPQPAQANSGSPPAVSPVGPQSHRVRQGETVSGTPSSLRH